MRRNVAMKWIRALSHLQMGSISFRYPTHPFPWLKFQTHAGKLEYSIFGVLTELYELENPLPDKKFMWMFSKPRTRWKPCLQANPSILELPRGFGYESDLVKGHPRNGGTGYGFLEERGNTHYIHALTPEVALWAGIGKYTLFDSNYRGDFRVIEPTLSQQGENALAYLECLSRTNSDGIRVRGGMNFQRAAEFIMGNWERI